MRSQPWFMMEPRVSQRQFFRSQIFSSSSGSSSQGCGFSQSSGDNLPKKFLCKCVVKSVEVSPRDEIEYYRDGQEEGGRIHPQIQREWVKEGIHVSSLRVGLLVQNADPQAHERRAEIHHFSSFRGNGQVADSQVGSLETKLNLELLKTFYSPDLRSLESDRSKI
jgi:hypothetical protein